jgi:formate hydrogenlyase subunit 6/NADH:ubiquinone oxidoreductase subunit I
MQAETGEAPRLALPHACISCLCCQEVCPAKAIETRKSLCAARAFRPRREEAERAAGAGP